MYEALQKETEEKEKLQLQLQAIEEALEELNHTNQNVQTDNIELKILLQEEKEEKYSLLRQMQAKDEALKKLQCDPCEVKINSLNSCMCPADDFGIFENHTIGIGSKFLKKISYE